MKCKVLLFAFVLPAVLATGQNLVPNGSFEEYIDCPYGTAEFHAQVVDWYSFAETPDYFHVCSNDLEGFAGVPDNAWGYQFPITGDAYAGLITFTHSFVNAREYIACPLLTPLVVGTEYYVMFHVSWYDGGAFLSRHCATDRIGAKFFMGNNYGPQEADWYLPQNESDIQNNGFITDSENWTLVDGWFTADSNYQWLALGNFHTDEFTDTLEFGDPNECMAIYYIENVCVATDPSFCSYLLGSKSIDNSEFSISVFPNPSIGNVHIVGNGTTISEVEFFDLSGKLLLSERPNRVQHIIQADDLSRGLYIMQVRLENGFQLTQKIILQ